MVRTLDNLWGRHHRPSRVVAVAADGVSWYCAVLAVSSGGEPHVERGGTVSPSLAEALHGVANGTAGNGHGAPTDAILLTTRFLQHRIVLPVPPATLPVGDELQQLVRWELEPRVAGCFSSDTDVEYCNRVLPSVGNGTREILAGALPADALEAWSEELARHRLRLRGVYPLEGHEPTLGDVFCSVDSPEPLLQAARHCLGQDEFAPVLCVLPQRTDVRRMVVRREWVYALVGVVCAVALAFSRARLGSDRAAWTARITLAGQVEAARSGNQKLAGDLSALRRQVQVQQRLVPDQRIRPLRVLDVLARHTPEGAVVTECYDEADGRVMISGWGQSVKANELLRQALLQSGVCLRADLAEDIKRVETTDGRARYPFAYRCTIRGGGEVRP
ncbi:MAG: hypothetical protein JXL80_05110 [Planctomycetes bacterium]|nr:hypothetical protein [Planctomycetota bacterium]